MKHHRLICLDSPIAAQSLSTLQRLWRFIGLFIISSLTVYAEQKELLLLAKVIDSNRKNYLQIQTWSGQINYTDVVNNAEGKTLTEQGNIRFWYRSEDRSVRTDWFPSSKSIKSPAGTVEESNFHASKESWLNTPEAMLLYRKPSNKNLKGSLIIHQPDAFPRDKRTTRIHPLQFLQTHEPIPTHDHFQFYLNEIENENLEIGKTDTDGSTSYFNLKLVEGDIIIERRLSETTNVWRFDGSNYMVKSALVETKSQSRTEYEWNWRAEKNILLPSQISIRRFKLETANDLENPFHTRIATINSQIVNQDIDPYEFSPSGMGLTNGDKVSDERYSLHYLEGEFPGIDDFLKMEVSDSAFTSEATIIVAPKTDAGSSIKPFLGPELTRKRKSYYTIGALGVFTIALSSILVYKRASQ